MSPTFESERLLGEQGSSCAMAVDECAEERAWAYAAQLLVFATRIPGLLMPKLAATRVPAVT